MTKTTFLGTNFVFRRQPHVAAAADKYFGNVLNCP